MFRNRYEAFSIFMIVGNTSIGKFGISYKNIEENFSSFGLDSNIVDFLEDFPWNAIH